MTSTNTQEGISQDDAMKMLENQLCTVTVVNELICALHNKTDETLDHVYCKICHKDPSITGNRIEYFCQNCKAAARMIHEGKYGHKVQWGLVKRLNENKLQLISVSKSAYKKYNQMITKSRNEKDIEAWETAKYVVQPMYSGASAYFALKALDISSISSAMQASLQQLASETCKNGLSVQSVKTFGKSLKQAGIIGKTARQWFRAGYLQLALCTVEIGDLVWSYNNGTITNWKELARRTGNVVSKNIGAYSFGYGGLHIGMLIGSLFPPLGAFIGCVIGAVLGGIIGDKLFGHIYQKLFPPSDQTMREQSLLVSLKYFDLKPKDLKNKKKFNQNYIDHVYKQKAKIHHPDTKFGNHEAFLELNNMYSILSSVLKGTKNGNKTVKQTVKAILR